jgi:hypothetical protein
MRMPIACRLLLLLNGTASLHIAAEPQIDSVFCRLSLPFIRPDSEIIC